MESDLNTLLDFFDLSIVNFVTLLYGFVGYQLIALDHRKYLDGFEKFFYFVLFGTLARNGFSLIEADAGILIGLVISFFGTLLLAYILVIVKPIFVHMVRGVNLTVSDRTENVFEAVNSRLADKEIASAMVVRSDSSELYLDNHDKHANDKRRFPFGTLILGEDGSVSIVATKFRKAKGSEFTDIRPEEYRTILVPQWNVAELVLEFSVSS